MHAGVFRTCPGLFLFLFSVGLPGVSRPIHFKVTRGLMAPTFCVLPGHRSLHPAVLFLTLSPPHQETPDGYHHPWSALASAVRRCRFPSWHPQDLWASLRLCLPRWASVCLSVTSAALKASSIRATPSGFPTPCLLPAPTPLRSCLNSGRICWLLMLNNGGPASPGRAHLPTVSPSLVPGSIWMVLHWFQLNISYF